MQAFSRFPRPLKCGISRRFFTFRYFFQLILGRFSGFLGPRPIRKSGNAVFLEEYEAVGTDFLPIRISDARNIHTPVVAASCRILGKVARCRFYFLRGKRFDFTSFRGFARSRHPSTVYGFWKVFFCTPNFKNSTFLVLRVHRTPQWLASSSCGILPQPC